MILTLTFFYEGESEAGQADQVSKTISFELSKDYEGCSFTITNEKIGDFEVVMWSEKNKEEMYNEIIETGNEYTISVQDAKEGNWNNKVTALVQIGLNTSETDGGQTYTEKTEETLLTPEEYIGQIKVSVKVIDKTAFAVGNVQVARDIVRLKYCFVDDTIVVEWTDNSCGNINVTIIDTKISQILDKQTVKGKHYEFELPSLTDEITIDVVPATSAGITRVNNQYTILAGNNPDTVITFDDLQYTNKNTIPFGTQLNSMYSSKMMCNGIETGETGLLSLESYKKEIPLNEGNNDLLAYVVDENGNMHSTTYSVILDSIKPTITRNIEYDGASEKEEKPQKIKNEKKAVEGDKKILDWFCSLSEKKKDLITTVIGIIVLIIVFKMILMPGIIPSGSMEPTLNVGDIVVANGLAYINKDPQRGDIVIFKTEELGNRTMIKRIIGVPGDGINFVDGYVYINGELVCEEYLLKDTETNSYRDFEVPDGCYFVMGDNRDNSYDSRGWMNPYITKDNIRGKMIVDIPVSRLIKTVKSFLYKEHLQQGQKNWY